MKASLLNVFIYIKKNSLYVINVWPRCTQYNNHIDDSFLFCHRTMTRRRTLSGWRRPACSSPPPLLRRQRPRLRNRRRRLDNGQVQHVHILVGDLLCSLQWFSKWHCISEDILIKMSGAIARIAKPVMRGLHVSEVKRYVVVRFKKYKPVLRGLYVSEVKR